MLAAAWSAAVALLAGCHSSGGGGGGCVPGEIASCGCAGDVTGTQTCAQDGLSFGPCSCGAATGAPAASSAGVGGDNESSGESPGTPAPPPASSCSFDPELFNWWSKETGDEDCRACAEEKCCTQVDACAASPLCTDQDTVDACRANCATQVEDGWYADADECRAAECQEILNDELDRCLCGPCGPECACRGYDCQNVGVSNSEPIKECPSSGGGSGSSGGGCGVCPSCSYCSDGVCRSCPIGPAGFCTC